VLEEGTMKNRSPVKYVFSLGAVLALLASAVWAQSDPSTATTPTTTTTQTTTTTEKTSKSKPAHGEKEDNTANFDKKTGADHSKDLDVVKRMNAAAAVMDEIMGTPDKGIPRDLLSDAKCIIVIPSMVKIAVGFGGEHGKGVATCRTTNGWSAPAPITITGGSWGLQIGGQATDLVMLVMNQKGMDHLLSSKFKIGAEASGAAGPVGREVSGNTDWKMRSQLLTYSRSRGVFAGINLNGASLKQDKDDTALLYGKFLPFETILSGKVPPPESSHTFLATIRKYATEVAREKQGE
jgi:SH3 domain-containing YSC84-like protein 1